MLKNVGNLFAIRYIFEHFIFRQTSTSLSVHSVYSSSPDWQTSITSVINIEAKSNAMQCKKKLHEIQLCNEFLGAILIIYIFLKLKHHVRSERTKWIPSSSQPNHSFRCSKYVKQHNWMPIHQKFSKNFPKVFITFFKLSLCISMKAEK